MPRLTSVTVLYGSTVDVLFTTSQPLVGASQTAVLQLADSRGTGSELGIRIERGVVIDFYLWDAAQKLRQRMPANEVVVNGRYISCVIPSALLPDIKGTAPLEAALIINGGATQTRFPVTVRSQIQSVRQPVATRSRF